MRRSGPWLWGRRLAERWGADRADRLPDLRAGAIYDQYYQVYRRLYERTAQEMHELTRLSESS